MNFIFIDKKADITEEIREYTRKKVSKLDKYLRHEGDAHVTFGKEGSTNLCEITVHSDSLYLRSRELNDDIYSAVDCCISAIERQIHKHKTRLAKRLHQNAFVREMPPTFDEPTVDEEVDFPVIKSKRFTVKPMTVEEAILQMNLLKHEFYVFKNFESDDAFSIVYHRKEGGYGLIVSE